MVALVRSTWPGELPFTILLVTSETACLYKNENLDAEWRLAFGYRHATDR